MGSNGYRPKLRVLLSGPAADRLEPALDREPGISMLGLGEADDSSPTDVALHVVDPEGVRRRPQLGDPRGPEGPAGGRGRVADLPGLAPRQRLSARQRV